MCMHLYDKLKYKEFSPILLLLFVLLHRFLQFEVVLLVQMHPLLYFSIESLLSFNISIYSYIFSYYHLGFNTDIFVTIAKISIKWYQ